MGRSIWKHPDHPARTFYVAEAIEQIERDEKRQAAA
jgi:hypothetical protein